MIGSEHEDERVAAPGTLAVAIAAPALELDGAGRVVAANGAARELWPGGPEGSTWRALFGQGRVPGGEAGGETGRAADTPAPATRLAHAGWSQWHWIPTPGAADGVAGLLVAADPPAPGSEGLGWQLFEALAENTPLIAGVKDRDGVIRYANPAWGSHLGVAPAHLIGRSEAEIYPPGTERQFVQGAERVFEDGETVELTEQGGRFGAGGTSWWRVTKFPVRAGGERLLGILAWDVTDRIHMQTALAASEAYAKAVLDTAVDAIVTIDTRGRINSFNHAAARMFGYRADEVVGRNVRLLMPEPYRASHDGYLSAYLNTGEAKIIGIGREVEARRKDGSVFPIELAVSEVVGGVEHGFTGIIKDLTDKKRTEQQLREREVEARRNQQRMAHLTRINLLGEMAAGIAHEVNQPLTAIATYAQACQRLIKSGAASDQALLETLDKVAAQARRAGEIIRRVRGLARNAEAQRVATDLNAVIHECLALLEHEARLQGIDIVPDLHAGLPVVVADPVQIQQVAINLLRNAMEALQDHDSGEPTRRIRISTARDGNAVRVNVADNGPGVAPEAAAKLFDHFFTTKASGMGIGLAISHSIISAHGGRLWCEPQTAGACFCFTLPTFEAGDG